ncbi:MAG: DUF4382 domain-containing protein [Gammaproteobacteria bacterium]|nr:DUF4382 domain-containing protein [Gammaproteobacteria bacterium]
MHGNMLQTAVRCALLTGLGSLAACGGAGDSQMTQTGTPPVTMPLTLSDASSADWALIGVRVLSIALVPQGGGSAITVWTAPSPAPYVNLEQLDQLGELLGNVTVPPGTYTGAILTVGANPGDVLLTVANDPESGFPLPGGTVIPAGDIQIQGKQGSSGAYTVPVHVQFDSALVASAGQSNALDLEFDLGHPAFILGHTPPAAGGTTLWAVNFNGPVRSHTRHDLTHLLLRHTYGTVQSVASDAGSFTIDKDFPVLPVTNPETATQSSTQLTIFADATNGTLFYDLDAKTHAVVKDFSTEAATLSGRFVRVAARYQEDGTLVAVRVWASNDFQKVWVSPEGHVLHVDAAQAMLTVSDESGRAVPVAVDASTAFYFRAPAASLADATPIGTGPQFLAADNLVRGFKVHVSVVDPLATPLVADSVDIETANYSGRISSPDSSGFTYTHQFVRTSDDYSLRLNYIAATTPNGFDGSGNPVAGFKWWNFTYPTLLNSGTGAVDGFVAAANVAVDFGGTVGPLNTYGASTALWGDPGNPSGWSAREVVLLPSPVPLGVVASGFANDAFGLSVPGGAQAVTVDVSTTAQAATLVYQVDRTNGVVTVSPIDITTAGGLAALTTGLSTGTPVKAFGIPQADGTLKAYVIVYFTGLVPQL